MKAKQQAAEAEKAAQAASSTEDNPSIQVSEDTTVNQATDTVVFNGGFFKVESPAKQMGEKALHLAEKDENPFCALYSTLLETPLSKTKNL